MAITDDILSWLGETTEQLGKNITSVKIKTPGFGVNYDPAAYKKAQLEQEQAQANLKRTQQAAQTEAVERLAKYGKPASVSVTPDTRAATEKTVGTDYIAPNASFEVTPGTTGTESMKGWMDIKDAEKIGEIHPSPKPGSRQVHIKGYGTRWVIPYPEKKKVATTKIDKYTGALDRATNPTDIEKIDNARKEGFLDEDIYKMLYSTEPY